MSELNLAEMDLVPFKTKAITVGGHKAVFCGMDTSGNPYCWALLQPVDGTIMFGCRRDGVVSFITSLSIARIAQKWVPALDDIVKVVGIAVATDRYGSVQDYVRHVLGSRTTYSIVGVNTPALEYYKIRHEAGTEYSVHRDSLRLVRRP